MKAVWLVWSEDKEGWFVAAVYDDEERAEEDVRLWKERAPKTVYRIEAKAVTK